MKWINYFQIRMSTREIAEIKYIFFLCILKVIYLLHLQVRKIIKAVVLENRMRDTKSWILETPVNPFWKVYSFWSVNHKYTAQWVILHLVSFFGLKVESLMVEWQQAETKKRAVKNLEYNWNRSAIAEKNWENWKWSGRKMELGRIWDETSR